jgi:hypothetical protein
MGTAITSNVATNANSGLVAAGWFGNSIDFGAGPLTQQGNAFNIFIASFDCSGNLLWAKRFGTPATTTGWDLPQGLATGPDGSIVVTGVIQQGQADFGTGPIDYPSQDGFVAKLDAAGNGVYAKRFGTGAFAGNSGWGAAVDGAGNAYVVGQVNGVQNLGCGPIGVSGDNDLFVLKLDPSGTCLWSKDFGNSGYFTTIALDPSGNVVVCGEAFGGMLNFGVGALPSAPVFVAKLSSSGGYLWAKTFSGMTNGEVTCNGVATGPAAEVVVTGSYVGSLDFGGGPIPSSSSTNPATFLAKFTSAGNYVFAKGSGGGGSTVGNGVAVNAAGEIYLTGQFDGGDFGGGLIPGGTYEVAFLAKFDPTGGLAWLNQYGNNAMGGAAARSIAIGGSGTPMVGGNYNDNFSFGPMSATPYGSAAFVARATP